MKNVRLLTKRGKKDSKKLWRDIKNKTRNYSISNLVNMTDIDFYLIANSVDRVLLENEDTNEKRKPRR